LCEATVKLLMVVPTPGTLAGTDAATGQLLPAATAEMLRMAENDAVAYLQQRLEPFLQAGVQASATVARGEPAAIVCEQAARWATDLVVLGTHGLTGFEAFWSGSVSPKLLGSIAASFLLAPAGKE
jgi:nucleotide-binding universal stress UspA family protein